MSTSTWVECNLVDSKVVHTAHSWPVTTDDTDTEADSLYRCSGYYKQQIPKQEEGPDGQKLLEPALRPTEPVAGADISPYLRAAAGIEHGVEFAEHACWNMLFVWPDPDHPNDPYEARCQGCGRAWRFEETYHGD